MFRSIASAANGFVELRTAAAALANGALDVALQAASDACYAAPEQAQSHYLYGQVLLALDRPAPSKQAFATAVRLDRGWADAWVNLGVASYRLNQPDEALAATRQALMRDPENAAACANLGALLRLAGDFEGAESHLRRALERRPHDAGARLNLAADLLQREQAAAALDLLDEAFEPAETAPAARQWRLQRSLALLQLGRLEPARDELAAFDRLGPCPPELAPLLRWRRLLLAKRAGQRKEARREGAAMEASLEDAPGLLPEHRIMAHYGLAKFWSQVGEPARAFAHWRSGHGLLRGQQPFSRQAHRDFVDANVEAFPKGRFERAGGAGEPDKTPVFIVGMPRSGTTLCEQILAAHRDVYGACERAALPQAFSALGGGLGAGAVRSIAGLDQPVIDEAGAAYLADLKALAPNKARIVDKLPGNYAHLGLVGRMLPGARVIHCVRDPRDIGLSIFTYRFNGQHPYAHDLADLGWTIAQQITLMEHWKKVLPNPILTVRLQDWVEDFDGTLNRVLMHLDLPPDPACARFHEAERDVRTASFAQVRQPVNARGLGRWPVFADDLKPLIAELEAAGALAGWADPAADTPTRQNTRTQKVSP